MKPRKVHAIRALGYVVNENNDDFDYLGKTPPSDSDIDTKLSEMRAEWIAKAYSRNREVEYPSIQECVHAILDDQLTALQEKRQAVKDKYPKG